MARIIKKSKKRGGKKATRKATIKTVTKRVYVKAKKAGEDVREADFRYPGPKPSSKESAPSRMDFPAPVCPVIMTRPSGKSTSRESIST